MRALLIRHGKTPGNAERRYIGRTDEQLSEEGRAEAEQIEKDCMLRKVYVSPLLRARETAAILFPNAEQIVLPDLRETDFGVFEGKNADEMAEDPLYRAWVDGWCLGQCPGGESRDQVTRRAVEAFTEAVNDASGPLLVFVTHGGVIMSILSELSEPKRDYYDFLTPPLEGWTAECVEEDGRVILRNPIKAEIRTA